MREAGGRRRVLLRRGRGICVRGALRRVDRGLLLRFLQPVAGHDSRTTCRCDACKAIPSLGLKFVTHFGTFMIERDDGREDLAGPDVILVHRLLKNTISDGDGPQAYAFFT
ncbi:MAG TPA: DUF2652 domain-containing protein [Dehalococcoidia bacterium]